MAEIVYAKKRIQPIIDKFGINPEDDVVFKSIIGLFNGQTDYQMWALKLAFLHVTPLDDIIFIKEWADANPTLISNLSRKNLVLYKNVADIAKLHEEMESLNAFHFVKSILNTFNTDQRKLLKSAFIDPVEEEAYNALKNSDFKSFYELILPFNALPAHRKEKFITLMSAVREIKEIMKHLKDALEETYEWNRTDLLSYVQNNCSDTDVCYDMNNVVILRLPNFEIAKKLCGEGRTSWCLTREERYFKQYVSEANRNSQQYALFDFNVPEKHELSHVGFTVSPQYGITHAHSTRNNNMMGNIVVADEKWDIHKLLSKHQIPKSAYVRLKPLKNYNWDKKDFLKKLNARNITDVIEMEDGKIAVLLNSSTIRDFVVGHTLIHNLSCRSDSKIFAILDFSKDSNDEQSILVICFNKDLYGALSIGEVFEPYGAIINDVAKIRKYNIDENALVKSSEIPVDVLLHKYIDEENFDAAIRLLNENKEVNPNFSFMGNIPITKAITKANFELFLNLIQHKDFDINTTEGFGEPCPQFILLYMESWAKTRSKDTEPYIKMCMEILKDERFDINTQDALGDTVLHSACECGIDGLPIIRFILDKANANINIKNMWDYTPLDVALERNNVDAVKLLLGHPDIVVNATSKNLAQEAGIDLNTINKPVEINPRRPDEYEDLFAKAFSVLE